MAHSIAPLLDALKDPLWLIIIVAAIGIFVAMVIYWLQKRHARKLVPVPFSFRAFPNPDELQKEMQGNCSLSLISNKYVPPVAIPYDEDAKKGDERILIIGRAEIGKTRHALERLKTIYQEHSTHSGGCAIAYAYNPSLQVGTPPPVPDALHRDCIIVFLDDVPSGLLRDFSIGESAVLNPLSTLENMIRDLESTDKRIFIIATAREENVKTARLNKFWKDFKRYHLEDITDRAKHDEVVRGMAAAMGIDITDVACAALHKANQGYSIEALQEFIKNRKNEGKSKIEEKDVELFSRETHEQWRKITYAPLAQQRPEVEFIYAALGYLRFHYEISPYPRDLVLNIAAHVASGKYSRKQISSAMKFLTEIKTALRLKNGIILCLDSHLEQPAKALSDKETFEYATPLNRLTEPSRVVLAAVLSNKGSNAHRENYYEDAVRLCEWSLESHPTPEAHFNTGLAQGCLERYEDAVQSYSKSIELGEKQGSLAVAAAALVNKGAALVQLRRFEEAIMVYDDVVSRFGKRQEVPLLAMVAAALVNKGVALGELKRQEDAIAVYDDVVSRFGKREELPVLEQVAKALSYKGFAFRELTRFEEAIAVYDEVIRRFGDREERALPEQVAIALVNKGVALRSFNRPEDEIAAYDEVVRKFGNREEIPFLEEVGQALLNKSAALAKLNRYAEAIAASSDVVSRLENRKGIPWTKLTAQALVNKGFAQTFSGKPDDAFQSYLEALNMRKFLPDKGERVLPRVVPLLLGGGTDACRANDEKAAREFARIINDLYEDTRRDDMDKRILKTIAESEKELETSDAPPEVKEAYLKFKSMLKFLNP